MKRMIGALAALLLTLLPTSAFAADYSIVDYRMAVEVKPDGSADISETLVYDFDGSYNGILSSLDVGDVAELRDLRLFVDGETELMRVDQMNNEPDTYVAEKSGRLVNIKGYAPGQGGMREFRYEYTLTSLARRYADAARLNYKLIGIANEQTLENAIIEITLPGDPIDSWAHGAMDASDISLREARTLVYGPVDVKPGQFVEADILFDAASLSSAAASDKHIVEAVRAQEAQLLEKEAQQATRRQRLISIFTGALWAMLAAFAAGFGLWASKLHALAGRSQKPAPLYDPDALKGVRAAVAQVLRQGDVDTDGLSATLLELVQAGAVTLLKPEYEGEDVSFRLKNRFVPQLTAHQQHVLEWLFPSEARLWVKDLGAGDSTAQAQAYEKNFARYKQLAEEETLAEGYLNGLKGRRVAGVVLTLAAGLALCLLTALMKLWIALALAGGFTLLALFAFGSVRTLTNAGEAKKAALEGLARHVAAGGAGLDAGQEHLLPLCAALGCLDPLFEERQPDWYAGTAYPYWLYYGWHHDFGRVRRDMHDMNEHNHATAHPESSSSGDSSSGGGGGGGGHGAW